MRLITALVASAGLWVSAAISQEVDIEVQEMARGEADAPVTFVEYASFTCPHCAVFHVETYPQLIEKYVETGQVRFVLREVYFDLPGLWASMVARCGGEELYFTIVDQIFEQQSDWISSRDPAVISENLKRLGVLAGLERDEVDACLDDSQKAEQLVAWYQANAAEDGVRSTPSFVINNELHGNMSWQELQQVLDTAIEDANQ